MQAAPGLLVTRGDRERVAGNVPLSVEKRLEFVMFTMSTCIVPMYVCVDHTADGPIYTSWVPTCPAKCEMILVFFTLCYLTHSEEGLGMSGDSPSEERVMISADALFCTSVDPAWDCTHCTLNGDCAWVFAALHASADKVCW